MTSQTQFPRSKAPGVRPALRKLEVSLAPPPSERWDELPGLDLFLFDQRRRFLGKAAVERGKIQVEGDFGRARMLRAVLAPRGMLPEAVASSRSLPALAIEAPEQAVLEFAPGWWEGFLLGQALSFHGRVEKVFGTGTLPIREGLVEVYEVDPWLWIAKLPDLELLRFRDDLLRLIEARLPETAAPPLPGSGPGPELSVLPVALRDVPFARTPVMLGAPRALPADGSKNLAGLMPASFGLRPQVLKALHGDSLRSQFLLHKAELLPLLELLLPDWWYHKAKLGEVPIKPDGTFSGFAGWWLPQQDQPDLYFRVRQVIEGVDKVIYAPKVASHTWWNYSGEEVVLQVTDPQAVAVDDSLVAQDDQVVFLGLGFDTTTDQPGAPGLVQVGPDTGLFRFPSGKLGPYGHMLHVVLDVDLYGLKAAGVSFYRLSWKRGLQNAIGNASDWTPLTTPVNRHYREVKVVGGNVVVSYPVVSLVPAPADVPAPLAGKEGLFRFADPVRDYVVIDRADRAFGIWDTEALHGGGLTPADVADTYTLRLEVFNASGADVTATTPILRIHRQEPDESYTTTALDPVKPFLHVHVDNRPMVAEIRDQIEAGATSTGTGCGFLVAGSGANVEVGIRAYHPGGVGTPGDADRFIDAWTYNVLRGSAATSCVSASVTDKNVGSDATWQNVPYAPDVPLQTVSHLLTGVTPFGDQRRCTFTVRLEACTLTRNGYDRLSHLDRADNAAFALIERNG